MNSPSESNERHETVVMFFKFYAVIKFLSGILCAVFLCFFVQLSLETGLHSLTDGQRVIFVVFQFSLLICIFECLRERSNKD